MNSTRLANQTRLALSPLRVPTFRLASLSTPFLARMVLRFGKETSIGSPLIRVNRLVTIIHRNICPQDRQHGICSISENEAKNLPYQAGNSNPNPEAGRELDANLIDLDAVTLGSRDRGDLALLDRLLYPSCVFLRRLRIVSRATFSVRAMPRCEVRSCRAAKIWDSFCGVMARLFGLSPKVFLQSRQRHLWVPESVFPNLTQSGLSQWGQ
jgi:hypothetical protein